MSEVQWYGIKVFNYPGSIEIEERIKWCNDNKINFITTSLRGIEFAGEKYTEEEMKSIGIIKGIDLSKMAPIAIGTAFFFTNKDDASLFKLVWK